MRSKGAFLTANQAGLYLVLHFRLRDRQRLHDHISNQQPQFREFHGGHGIRRSNAWNPLENRTSMRNCTGLILFGTWNALPNISAYAYLYIVSFGSIFKATQTWRTTATEGKSGVVLHQPSWFASCNYSTAKIMEVSWNGGPPNHPKLDHFSFKTQSVGPMVLGVPQL